MDLKIINLLIYNKIIMTITLLHNNYKHNYNF
jgi:hypothetical protein